MNLFKLIEGKKTYITSIALALYGVLKVFNIINTTPEQDTAIFVLLGAMFGVSIKSAISKLEK